MYYLGYGGQYGLLFLGILITLGAQLLVSASYSKYSKKNNSKCLTGSEVARKILDKNGLSNVYVVEQPGHLTDHYDPTRKVVRLSSHVFHGKSIASLAVAAHECGHAIQDKNNYVPMRMRSLIIPAVNFSSYAGYFAIIISFVTGNNKLFWAGIIMLCIILLFQLITLPVEFNASNRALKKIQEYKLVDNNDLEGSKKMLTAAALTYVASVATVVLQILRLILLHGNRRD